MIKDFVNLYFKFGSIDNALVEYEKEVTPSEYERFLNGLSKLRKGSELK